MDKVTKYRQLIKSLLKDGAKHVPAYGEIDSHLVFDDENGSYQLMYIGWNNARRVHGMIIHVRLRGEKIWVEHDGSSDGFVDQLLDAGVPYEDIVLGFHSRWKRELMEFAVA